MASTMSVPVTATATATATANEPENGGAPVPIPLPANKTKKAPQRKRKRVKPTKVLLRSKKAPRKPTKKEGKKSLDASPPQEKQKPENENDVNKTAEKERHDDETKDAVPPRKRARKSSVKAIVPARKNSSGNSEEDAATVTTNQTAITASEEEPGAVRMSDFCSKFKAKPPVKAEPTVQEKQKARTDRQTNGYGAEEADKPLGPTVQIINGEIVLQESSMVLHGNVKPPDEDDDNYQVVEEEDQLGVIGSTYTSFSKHTTRSRRWDAAETALFYTAFRQVGVDFVAMEAFFAETTKRTRKMLKAKYRRELDDNPHLIDAALGPKARKEIDLSVFSVTAEDVANIERPKDPVPPELIESTNDSNKKLKLEKSGSNPPGDDEQDVVVEEEDVFGEPKNKSAASQKPTSLASFWLQEDDGPSSSSQQSTTELVPPEEMDPLLQGDDEEEPSQISLVSRATNLKNKPKKPKFRSRKKGK